MTKRQQTIRDLVKAMRDLRRRRFVDVTGTPYQNSKLSSGAVGEVNGVEPRNSNEALVGGLVRAARFECDAGPLLRQRAAGLLVRPPEISYWYFSRPGGLIWVALFWRAFGGCPTKQFRCKMRNTLILQALYRSHFRNTFRFSKRFRCRAY
jgi:hypothetical protein